MNSSPPIETEVTFESTLEKMKGLSRLTFFKARSYLIEIRDSISKLNPLTDSQKREFNRALSTYSNEIDKLIVQDESNLLFKSIRAWLDNLLKCFNSEVY